MLTLHEYDKKLLSTGEIGCIVDLYGGGYVVADIERDGHTVTEFVARKDIVEFIRT